MTLTAFLKVSTSTSVPNDLTGYPIALNTFFLQPAVSTSLRKSHTALTHSFTGGLISSSLFMRPITNARNRRKSDAKGGEIRYVFFLCPDLTCFQHGSHIYPRQNRGLWFHIELHTVHVCDHLSEAFITPHSADQHPSFFCVGRPLHCQNHSCFAL